jgi:hypothetical protein
LFVLTNLSRAADDAASREIVEKGIEAQGGETPLAKFKASTAKIKGTIYIAGAPVPFTGEIAGQGADQQKVVISLEADGQTFSLITVKRDGKPHADVEVEEFKPAEKRDDSLFAKP